MKMGYRPKFDGEELYSQLNLMIVGEVSKDFDVDQYANPTVDKHVVQQQIEYGKAFWSLMSKQCRHHEGFTLGFPPREVCSSGEVAVACLILTTL
jgi:hypothetical protein